MTGKKLAAARKELASARKAVDALRVATHPDDEEDHWKDFLHCLTRFWNKTQSALKGDPRFYNSPHVKHVKAAQKSDDLIRYLARARDSDEHRHDEIAGVIPGGFEHVSLNGRLRVRNPRITINGVTMDLPPAPGQRRRAVRAEMRLRPVRNEQQTYDVPQTHAGQDISGDSAATLAELGLAFYASILDGLARDGWDS